ncbi:MAG: hypothetical protein WEA04_03235 [Candidatus Andersenbacteria bacterium]
MNRPLILAAAVFVLVAVLIGLLTWQQNYLLKSNIVAPDPPPGIPPVAPVTRN